MRKRWLGPALALSAATALSGAAATGSRAGTAAGLPAAPASQSFAQFGPCPPAPAGGLVPAGSGCVTVRRADVLGNGRTDLVLLYARLNTHGEALGFTLEVVAPGGRRLTLRLARTDMNISVALVRNVNARPGVELFLHEGHVTTDEVMGVYTFDGRRLALAGRFAFDGVEAGILSGFTCHAGGAPAIVQHVFQERTPFAGVWERTNTTYRWVGARLSRGASETVRASPSAAEVGVHC